MKIEYMSKSETNKKFTSRTEYVTIKNALGPVIGKAEPELDSESDSSSDHSDSESDSGIDSESDSEQESESDSEQESESDSEQESESDSEQESESDSEQESESDSEQESESDICSEHGEVIGGDIFDDAFSGNITNDKVDYLWSSNTLMDLRRFIHGKVPIQYQYLEAKVNGKWKCITHEYINSEGQSYEIKIGEFEPEVAGVPIDIVLASIRQSFVIKNLHHTLSEFSHVRVYDFLNLVDIPAAKYYIDKDRDNALTFYNGFVEKFFPMTLMSEIFDPQPLDIWCDHVHTKVRLQRDIMKQQKSRGSKTIKSIDISSSGKFNLQIMTIYNSLDLDGNLLKIEAYIKSKQILLEKIKKNQTSSTPKVKSDISYIKFYYANATVCVFSNGKIESTVHTVENTKEKLFSYFENNIIKKLPVKLGKLQSEIVNVDFEIIYPVKMSTKVVQLLTATIEKYEEMEEYNKSVAMVNKDAIILFIANRRYKFFSNEFEALVDSIENRRALFSKRLSITFTPHVTSIAVSVKCLDKEFAYRERFCDSIVGMVSKANVSRTEILKKDSKVKTLKSFDPKLFTKEYSRICQAQQQPIITTKSKGTAFWNFTTGEPAYYACDSKVFKHLKFITDQHPEGYCLPCCKKKEIFRSTSYIGKHNQCLNTYKFDSNENIATVSSRYVSVYSYRVEVEPAKLMKISPTLKKFFRSVEDVYMYGVAPFSGSFKSFMLPIMAQALNVKPVDIIKKVCDFDDTIFYSLLKGQLIEYFNGPSDFRQFLMSNSAIETWSVFIDWDQLFIEAAMVFDLGVIVLHESENDTLTDSQLMLETGDLSYEKYIIVMKRRKSVVPIVMVDMPKYFSTGFISGIIHHRKDSLMRYITLLPTDEEKKENMVEAFVNDHNQVFLACIEYESGKYVYKTVDYVHASKVKVPVYKSLEDSKHKSTKADAEKYTTVIKWVEYGEFQAGVAKNFLLWIRNENESVKAQSSTELSQDRIKLALYNTNQYNLLMLHTANKGEVVVSDTNNDLPFDRNFGQCVTSNYYCSGNKFLLRDKHLLEILEKDLANPYKKMYIEQFHEISGIGLYVKDFKNSKTIITTIDT
jgi:hypothetical protein